MVGRRAMCALGLGIGLTTLGCTPRLPVATGPAPISAIPARRTSVDADTNRILAEVGETIVQLTVFPDRVYVTSERREELLSTGGPFAPVSLAPIPVLYGDPLPTDSFLVGTVRRLVRELGGDFGVVARPNEQTVLEVRKGEFPGDRTIRCVLPPERVVPAFDYQTEQGIADGLAELREVPRSSTCGISLIHDSHQGTFLAWEGIAEDQRLVWTRDQYRPLDRAESVNSPMTETFDPAPVTAQVLHRVGEALTQRAGDLIRMDIIALSRDGKPTIQFTATAEQGSSLVGDADLRGRIVKIR